MIHPLRIGVLASGNGTNLQAVIDACASGALDASVRLVISNKSHSGAAGRAARHGIPFRHLSSHTHSNPADLDRAIRDTLAEHDVDLVFLAGYMKQIGAQTLERFRGRMINTHPALLPRFGGQGMYGMNVHRAVIAAREVESGVTIHLVDPDYDTGPIVAQCRVPVLPADTAESLAERVQARERAFVVETLQGIASGRIVLDRVL